MNRTDDGDDPGAATRREGAVVAPWQQQLLETLAGVEAQRLELLDFEGTCCIGSRGAVVLGLHCDRSRACCKSVKAA